MEFSLTDASVVQSPFVLTEFPFLQVPCAGWMPMKHLNRKVLSGPRLTTGPEAGFHYLSSLIPEDMRNAFICV